MRIRRSTVEHPYGTIKAWMGWTHFLTKGLDRVKNEMSLHVLAYNLKRLIALLGIASMMDAIRAYAHFLALKTLPMVDFLAIPVGKGQVTWRCPTTRCRTPKQLWTLQFGPQRSILSFYTAWTRSGPSLAEQGFDVSPPDSLRKLVTLQE
jgi:hypothetical protein